MKAYRRSRVLVQPCVLFTLFCLCAFYPMHAPAQGGTASLNGVIKDSTGAVISGAKITARNTETNLTQTSQTNNAGVYSISPLPPGPYSVSAERSGFVISVAQIVLSVDQNATLDLDLKAGSESQTVTVTAGNVLLNTTSAEISTVVNERTISELPLNGRDPSSLALLAPGIINILNTNAGYTQNTDSFSNQGGTSAGGGQQGSTFALLDGVPNMDTYLALTAPFPNADATQEFRVISNNFGVQYGFSPGAVISIQTKSGNNSFHGGAFEFLRNGALNAGNYFTGLVDPLKRNQFGGYLGGPVLKNKLFFFANYQGTRQSLTSSTNTTFTPTAAMLQGDFSAVPVTLSAPFQTVNGKPNQVSPSLLSPAAVTISQTALPLGQDPATGQVNYANPNVLTNYNEGTGRVDYTISDSQRLFARSFIQEFDIPARTINGNILAGSIANIGQYYNAAIGHTWIKNQKLVNVVTAAWIRDAVVDGNEVFDNSGKAVCFSRYIDVGDPGCFIQGAGVNDGFNLSAWEPNNNERVTWWLSDQVTRTFGKHILNVGVNLAHQWSNTQTYYPGPPIFNFSGYATGFGLADWLLGDVANFEQGAFQNSPVRGWQLGVYAEDQYKLSPRMTVTAGLRWEPDIAGTSLNGGLAFVPGAQSGRYTNAPPGLLYPGDPGVNAALRPSNYLYFQPRIGIAWQPLSPRTVFRAGFGLFVAPISYSYYNVLVGVAPFAPFYSLYATPSSPISFQNPWAGFATTGGKSPFPPFTQNPQVPASQAIFLTPLSIYGSFSRTFHLPVTQSWNASVEQQLTKDLALHLAYVGSETYHLSAQVDQNPGLYAEGGNRPDPLFTSLIAYDSIGTASYHALQVGIEKRLSFGLQLQSNFTWAKTIDLLSGGTDFYHDLPNPFDIRYNRGISDMSIPLVSVTNFVYQAPRLSGHNEVLKQVVGGWQLSGIWTFQSGEPFGIVGGDGNNNSEAQQYQDRADRVPGQALGVHSGGKANWLNTYFNPAAFAINAPGTFGNSAKNLLNGPGINTADIALVKNWEFVEHYRLQFRWEMFNALNHPDFGLPVNDPSVSNVGQITAIGPIPPRVAQAALKLSF